MDTTGKNHPSLENLFESGVLGLEILHPGGLDITRQLAQLCRIGKDTGVLDVASGTGESACYLAEEMGARVVGIDGSDYMIGRARKKAEQRNLAIDFRKGDAHELPFRENTFDAVISECTTCILDKERAIREMARVVKPGGFVGIHDICWKEDTPGQIKNRLAEIEGEKPETLEGWETLFEKASLVDVQSVDCSSRMLPWVREIKKKLGFGGQLKVFAKVLRMSGIRGIQNVWESGRIFQSEHVGYGIIVGRIPSG
jgi:ubiquinone/menaquinone biosynthesis C-methylase UbiE